MQELTRIVKRDERGLALIVVLIVTLLVTGIGAALIGLMNTDVTHAGIHYAKARSYYAALAGLEQAKVAIFGAADPTTFATSAGGVTGTLPAPSGGQYTYWVDAGPAGGSPCGPGLKTLEAVGQVPYLANTMNSRVRACGVPGAPFLTALFGVSLVEAQGATSRTYVAPFTVGSPGAPRGGAIGSFTELNFSDSGLRLNALSETGVEYLTLRDPTGSGTVTVPDYTLFGFNSQPIYETNPAIDPLPWVLSAFGDIVKAQPTTGPLTNRCVPYTPYACVTTGNSPSPPDIMSIAELRDDYSMRHVYMSAMPQSVLPRLCTDPNLPQFCLDPNDFRNAALVNGANNTLNTAAGLTGKTDSAYSPTEFDQIVTYLVANPGSHLQGDIYIDGSYTFTQSVNLGGNTGNVTLAVRGDLVINGASVVVTNRHDLTTVAGRRTPGVLIFGLLAPTVGSTNVCRGERANGSGRLIMCGGSSQVLILDGFLYTADGMFIGAQGTIDQTGAMYHENRGTSNPSYTNQNSTVVVRFDPLSLSFFNSGVALVSWQQLK